MRKVTPEEFVRVWTRSASIDEVVDGLTRLLGSPVSRAWVCSRAGSYRKRGVALKAMPRGRRRINVPSLNRIASPK